MNNSSCLLSGMCDGKLMFDFYHGDKQEPVGCFYLVFYPTSIYIDWIYLEEEFRGNGTKDSWKRGLGNEIVTFVIEFCRKFSYLYKTVWLMVDFDNEIAQHIYRKFGFEFDNWIGSYCYRMTLRL